MKSTKNSIVLCIEIGGTSSRFALFNVQSGKSEKIVQISKLIKKEVDCPQDLVQLVARSTSFFNRRNLQTI